MKAKLAPRYHVSDLRSSKFSALQKRGAEISGSDGEVWLCRHYLRLCTGPGHRRIMVRIERREFEARRGSYQRRSLSPSDTSQPDRNSQVAVDNMPNPDVLTSALPIVIANVLHSGIRSNYVTGGGPV